MLKINMSEKKQFSFETQLGGIQADSLSCYLRFIVNEVEYGFPGKIGNEYITVDVPPLNKIIGKVNEGEEVEVKLELLGDKKYIAPWKEKVLLVDPFVIEAKMVETDSKKIPIQEGSSEDILFDKLVNRLTEKLETKIDKVTTKPIKKSNITETDLNTIVSMVAEKFDHLTKAKSTPSKISRVQKLVDQSMGKMKVHNERRLIKNKRTNIKEGKKENLTEFRKNLTKEDIFKFIDKKITKNTTVQEILYNQAVSAAKSKEPIAILSQVIQTVKRLKSQ